MEGELDFQGHVVEEAHTDDKILGVLPVLLLLFLEGVDAALANFCLEDFLVGELDRVHLLIDSRLSRQSTHQINAVFVHYRRERVQLLEGAIARLYQAPLRQEHVVNPNIPENLVSYFLSSYHNQVLVVNFGQGMVYPAFGSYSHSQVYFLP
jgi:hypothetical protein